MDTCDIVCGCLCVVATVIALFVILPNMHGAMRQPDENLKWAEMKLIDKQLINDGGLLGSYISYQMVFKSDQYGIQKYMAQDDEYYSHNIGENVSVGINQDERRIDSIHHGNDYGNMYQDT